MKRKRDVFIGLGVAFILTMFAFGGLGTADASDTRVVKLTGQSYPDTTITINPETLVIQEGFNVVWSNWVRAPRVEINFREGGSCQDATEAPVGFRIRADDCFVTDFVKMGETSSLKFNKAGTFEYTVTASSEGKATITKHGKIVVKAPK